MRAAARILGYVWLAGSLLTAAAFGFLYYAFYWRWRDLFNSEGRYFDPASSVVYHAQSGGVYLAFGVLCLGSALLAATALKLFGRKARA